MAQINEKFEDTSRIKEEKPSIDYKDKYLRAKAELENYRKFMERQKSDYIKYSNEKLIIEFLRIYDDLKRAIKVIDNEDLRKEDIESGLKMILENFRKVLSEQGVETIDCTGLFDPCKHECMMIEKNETLPDDTITEELQEGYCLNGKVIRPSKVKINKNIK